jgi:hypothetical protein
MYSLNQEFPAGKGHVTFLKKRSELVVDEKTGKFFTVQEVESQVYFTGRDERPLTGRNERLASEKVEIPASPPSSGSPPKDIKGAAAVAWVAKWLQNGWVAQWVQNTTYVNT